LSLRVSILFLSCLYLCLYHLFANLPLSLSLSLALLRSRPSLLHPLTHTFVKRIVTWKGRCSHWLIA
jgi:hypothetical protein